jgi:endonuclease YncB( thermonuclease family)
MKRLLLLIVTLAIVATSAQAAEIKGRARVIDGDTLWVGRIKIRLNGIDAPERGQPRYRAATQALQRLVAGKTVTCHLNGDKTYDRFVGVCYVGEHDLAASVIATGNALDCARYSGGRYRKYETNDARRYIRQARYC